MEPEDEPDLVVWNAMAASAIAESQRLLCVAAVALADDEPRESASALNAALHLVSQLEGNVTERWARETATDAIEMRALFEQDVPDPRELELRDESNDDPAAQDDN